MPRSLDQLREFLDDAGNDTQGAIVITVSADYEIGVFDNMSPDVPPEEKRELMWKIMEHAKEIATGHPAQCCEQDGQDHDISQAVVNDGGIVISAEPHEIEEARASVAAMIGTPAAGILRYFVVAVVPDPSGQPSGTLLARTDCNSHEFTGLSAAIAAAAPRLAAAPEVPDDLSGIDGL